jgi:hypothetical protein
MAPETQKAERPGGTGRLVEQEAPGQRERDYSAASGDAPINRFLGRFDRVRRCGKGWIARCAAHEDKTASLSITEGEGGAVLVHCFAGCRAADVVAAVGLELADLFVKKPTADMSFAERAALREHGRQAQWKACLNALAYEATIIVIAARMLKRGEPLDDGDEHRVDQALDRITAAQEVFNARRN